MKIATYIRRLWHRRRIVDEKFTFPDGCIDNGDDKNQTKESNRNFSSDDDTKKQETYVSLVVNESDNDEDASFSLARAHRQHGSISNLGGEEAWNNEISEAALATITALEAKDGKESLSEVWRRRRIVAMYLITITLLFADMNLMAPNLTEISDEFGFDEDERDVKLGGLIALAFFLVGSPISFLVGWLADSVKRSPLYAVTVLIGEAACFATYFVSTYAELFVCRTLTGISIGGAIPVIYSVLSDLYPANQRVAVSAILATGTGLGAGIGQALAGFLGDKYGWRFPFLVVSIPGFFFAGFLFCIKDPERGDKEAAKIEFSEERKFSATSVPVDRRHLHSRQEESHVDSETHSSRDDVNSPANEVVSGEEDEEENYHSIEINLHDCAFLDEYKTSHNSIIEHNDMVSVQEIIENENGEDVEEVKKVSWRTTWTMLKTPSVALVVLQAAPGALPFGFISTFLNDYLQEDKGMTKKKATSVLIVFGAGNAIGVILGGIVGHRAYRRDPRGPPIVMGISLILSCIPMYFLINSVDNDSSHSIVMVIGICAGMLAVLPVPIERAILANVTLPEDRGRANSVLSIIDDLGKGLGPALVSLLITSFDRQTAFNISTLGWVVAGIISLFIFFFVKVDEERIQGKVREQLEKEEECGKVRMEASD